MPPTLVEDYKIDSNGLPNILNGSQKGCNLCKVVKAPDSRNVLLNRRGKKCDSVINNTFTTDKDRQSAHNQHIKPPTPHQISTPANINSHNHTPRPPTYGDNRLQYRRKYDPDIFGRNQLDRFILPPLQL
ncbi:uncharacterized protein LOC132261222 [Phlebotomus argentipes]|uniref:uncharacterized protein LOC132261222 n=1 Tax=Phlebotomus argentipes TaxID=94469 RepID=UPI0028936B17|nr:uncharacterized protein LOC132261222 [Phlebotomus argentipes]